MQTHVIPVMLCSNGGLNEKYTCGLLHVCEANELWADSKMGHASVRLN